MNFDECYIQRLVELTYSSRKVSSIVPSSFMLGAGGVNDGLGGLHNCNVQRPDEIEFKNVYFGVVHVCFIKGSNTWFDLQSGDTSLNYNRLSGSPATYSDIDSKRILYTYDPILFHYLDFNYDNAFGSNSLHFIGYKCVLL